MNRAERRAIGYRGADRPDQLVGGVEPARHVMEAMVRVLMDKLGYELVQVEAVECDVKGGVQLRGCRYELEGAEGQRVLLRIMDGDMVMDEAIALEDAAESDAARAG